MTEPSLISLFVRPLNQLRIPYLVTGGVAAVIYGEPRMTRDIDLVVGLRPSDATRFAGAWPAAEFYVPPVEVIAEESRRPAHGHFNVLHHDTSLRADVYLPGSDPLNAWAFKHTVIRQVEGDEVVMAPIESVILGKLRFYQMGKSARHLRDINAMLQVSGEEADRAVIQQWATRLGVLREWEQAQEYQE